MRRLFAPLGVLALIVAGLGYGASASVTKASSYAATQRIVVRPVTTTGHARAGFTVTGEPQSQVDCSYPQPSPGAVNPNIEFCSPSAEYAIACWKSATAHRVLCMRDPRKQRLVQIPRQGSFAPTAMAPVSQRAPLLIVLLDGTFCSIRDGGAWGSLRGHPNWYGTYSCNHHGDVWASPHAAHSGVNESTDAWTVHTASNAGPLVTRHIKRAYFVGTFHQ